MKGVPTLRKIVPLSAAALVLSVSLTACGGPAVDSVKLTNDPKAGTAPSVEFKTPMKAEEAGTKVLREGDGEKINEGDNILLQAALFKGSDGSSLGDTYSKGSGQVLTVNDKLKEAIPEMYEALINAKEGEIIAYTSPDTKGAAGDDSTSVEVYQVSKKILAPINEDMKDVPKGLPKVTQDDKGTPKIAKPTGKEPTKLRTEILVQGDGDEVKAQDTVIANYVGVRWADGKEFDSSYSKGTPASFPLDNVIEGWKEGLQGKKVGDRVMLVVPADKAYGTTKQLGKDSQYPAGALVFVVDILGTTDTPKEETATPTPTQTKTPETKKSAKATSSPSPKTTDK